jgi:hypothetical protein
MSTVKRSSWGKLGFMLLIGIGAFALTRHEPTAEPTTKTVELKHDAPGCYKREDMDKLLELVLAKDRLPEAAMISSACPIMSKDAAYTVSERPFSDNICIRKVGEVDCRWTNKGWLKE